MLFCVYIEKLLKKLSAAGVGCYMGSTFVGALAYADDIVLICPTPSALHLLLKLCDDYLYVNTMLCLMLTSLELLICRSSQFF